MWKPGTSGNPYGRPKRGNTFADLLEKELKKRKYSMLNPEGKPIKMSGKQAIIQAHLAIIFSKVASDEVKMRAIDSMYERCDGRPRQAIELTGTEGGPVEIANMSPEERKARILELGKKLGITT